MTQQFSNTDSWKLLFCAGYIVQPSKGLEPDAAADSVVGSPIDITTIPLNFFLPLFIGSVKQCPIDISFVPEDGKQENVVRSLVRSLAFEPITEKVQAAQALASRLACTTTRRSPPGLLVVLAGQKDEQNRVLLWKFPANESLQARISARGLTIRFLQDVFASKSTYFKAAMFEGTQASTAFWRGKVEDKQAKQRVAEAADFWVVDFLAARSELTAARGTRLLARGLRETMKHAKTVNAKEALAAAAQVIKTQVDRDVSLHEFANNYLPEESRQTFMKAIGSPTIAETSFRIDDATLDKEFRYKSIVLDNDFVIKGPLDQFDNVVNIQSSGQEGIVEVSLQGRIISQTVQMR